jgi:hypothetical protein
VLHELSEELPLKPIFPCISCPYTPVSICWTNNLFCCYDLKKSEILQIYTNVQRIQINPYKVGYELMVKIKGLSKSSTFPLHVRGGK